MQMVGKNKIEVYWSWQWLTQGAIGRQDCFEVLGGASLGTGAS